MLETKFSSGVGTVHFKAIYPGMGGNEPKVVQEGSAKGEGATAAEQGSDA
jgi:hypothetical protein